MSAVRLLPWGLHEGLEYLAGIVLVLAPLILDFSSSPAAPVFVGAGVAVLLLAVLTRGKLGVVGVVPTAVHAILDYVLGFFLILSPFAVGFADEEPALYAAVLVGVAHLVITLATRFPVGAAAPVDRAAPADMAGGEPAPEHE